MNNLIWTIMRWDVNPSEVSQDPPDPRLVHSVTVFVCPLGGRLECTVATIARRTHVRRRVLTDSRVGPPRHLEGVDLVDLASRASNVS